jgi:succinoglycan biosynthesis protein ExoW
LPDQVLIVDDGSPVPAEPETVRVSEALRSRLEIIWQRNAGPGAARNLALDRVRPGIEFVAFLDSDDEWEPQHLAVAVAALECGHDIFFAEFTTEREPEGWIARNMKQAATFPVLSAGSGCREFGGDLARQILRSNPIAMPTAVYRFAKYSTQRFPTDFTTAEVNVFWLELALAGARAAFSTELHSRLGRGVNIYRGHQQRTVASLGVLHNSARFRWFALRQMKLDAAQTDTARTRLGDLSRQFATELVWMLDNPREVPWRTVARQVRMAPATLGFIASEILGRLGRRVRRSA